MVHCKHREGDFGLGVVWAAPMVIVALLQEGVVCRLGEREKRKKMINNRPAYRATW